MERMFYVSDGVSIEVKDQDINQMVRMLKQSPALPDGKIAGPSYDEHFSDEDFIIRIARKIGETSLGAWLLGRELGQYYG
jgi:hypothetical protein